MQQLDLNFLFGVVKKKFSLQETGKVSYQEWVTALNLSWYYGNEKYSLLEMTSAMLLHANLLNSFLTKHFLRIVILEIKFYPNIKMKHHMNNGK